jgi:hypothetical protein
VDVQRGESISTLLGTSNPMAIEAFLRANQMTNSTIIVGQPYLMPNDDDYAASTGALGQ